MPIEVLAPAKVNLTLHVTGRRADGYHLLDSLVAFAEVGDTVRAWTAKGELDLEVTGPEAAGVPAGDDNLVLRAARLMRGTRPAGPGARLLLEKRLPSASGLGGGSADAAAAIRALSVLWNRAPPGPQELLKLGADVPVCMAGRPARLRGIGECLVSVPPLPSVWLVFVNPRVECPTGAVFSALTQFENPPMPDPLPHWRDAPELAGWMRMMRNDLESAARARFPVIGDELDALTAQSGCLMARMSGSGATCFGLFADPLGASGAANALRKARPGWWIDHGALQSTPPQARLVGEA